MCYVWKFFFLKSLRILKPIHMPNHFPASLQPSFRWMIILYSMLSNVTESALLHYICLKQIHVPVTRLQIFESLLKQRNFQFHHLQLIFPYTKHPVSLCIVYFFYISVLFQTVSRNPGWSLSHAAISESRCLIISSLSCGRTPLIVIRSYGWLPKKMQSFIFNARSSIFSSSISSRSVSCTYSPLSQSSSSSLPRKTAVERGDTRYGGYLFRRAAVASTLSLLCPFHQFPSIKSAEYFIPASFSFPIFS